jgi:hypothetical protein
MQNAFYVLGTFLGARSTIVDKEKILPSKFMFQ